MTTGRFETCTKIRYPDHQAAALALASIRRKGGTRRPKTEGRVYRCQACGGWHLTSAERWR